MRDSIAFVPTMGALHDGHLALIRRARELSSSVVVSIFVNPLQFENPDDLAKYPRDIAGDTEKALSAGATRVWAPTFEEIYPGEIERQSAGLIGSIGILCAVLLEGLKDFRLLDSRHGLVGHLRRDLHHRTHGITGVGCSEGSVKHINALDLFRRDQSPSGGSNGVVIGDERRQQKIIGVDKTAGAGVDPPCTGRQHRLRVAIVALAYKQGGQIFHCVLSVDDIDLLLDLGGGRAA